MIIPAEFYRAFVAYMPILCVDLIIRNGNKVLLVKRANEPLKGEWWIPGGRVFKGESLIDAARRKAITEVRQEIEPKFIGIYEGRFETSAQGLPCHGVSIVFEGCSTKTPMIDAEH